MVTKKEIDNLLNAKGDMCLTLSAGLTPRTSERNKNKTIIARIQKTAGELITSYLKTQPKTTLAIEQNLDKAVSEIDLDNCHHGIGIFVSEQGFATINYPFYVNTQARIGNTFMIRDLLYYANCVFDYNIIVLSKHRVHLFRGYGPQVKEVQDEKFPCTFSDDYEYSRPTIGTSYGSGLLKNYERDKSILQEIRVAGFFREVDDLFKTYNTPDLPLLVMGAPKEINNFIGVTVNSKNLLGTITGEYQHNGNQKISDLAWNEILLNMQRKNEALLEEIAEMYGKRRIAEGIKQVWDAAYEGKGLELVVEKDLRQHAFLSKDGRVLYTQKPLYDKDLIFMPDAIEEIIRIVRDKKGKIRFVENEALLEHGGIVLILRYE